MKTVEEVKQLINQRLIELKELPSSVWICKELEVLLAIIDEPPPCTHIKGIGNMRHPSAGWMPFRAYVDHEWKPSEIVFDTFKFCPYCGEKLND